MSKQAWLLLGIGAIAAFYFYSKVNTPGAPGISASLTLGAPGSPFGPNTVYPVAIVSTGGVSAL